MHIKRLKYISILIVVMLGGDIIGNLISLLYLYLVLN